MTCIRRIAEVALQQFIANARDDFAVRQRKQYFHPMIQIARHQVGAAQVNFLVSAVMEIIDPAVFQKPPHDAGDFDIFADTRQARPQQADSPHQQLDSHARLRRAV